jgi:uncharacterized coiled-coil DUF342 family protein
MVRSSENIKKMEELKKSLDELDRKVNELQKHINELETLLSWDNVYGYITELTSISA